jgi:hypothetical protein
MRMCRDVRALSFTIAFSLARSFARLLSLACGLCACTPVLRSRTAFAKICDACVLILGTLHRRSGGLGSGGGGNLGTIAPAMLHTARVGLVVTRGTEDSSIGRAVMALVTREPLVEGGGGGGLGAGRGNYILPLAVVRVCGPIASALLWSCAVARRVAHDHACAYASNARALRQTVLQQNHVTRGYWWGCR